MSIKRPVRRDDTDIYEAGGELFLLAAHYVDGQNTEEATQCINAAPDAIKLLRAWMAYETSDEQDAETLGEQFAALYFDTAKAIAAWDALSTPTPENPRGKGE